WMLPLGAKQAVNIFFFARLHSRPDNPSSKISLNTRNVRTRLGLSADISLAAQSSQSNFAARDKRKPAKEVRFNHRRPAPFCVAGGWGERRELTAARPAFLDHALRRS